jgi:hypothetical protein
MYRVQVNFVTGAVQGKPNTTYLRHAGSDEAVNWGFDVALDVRRDSW